MAHWSMAEVAQANLMLDIVDADRISKEYAAKQKAAAKKALAR